MNFLKNAKDFIVKKWKQSNKRKLSLILSFFVVSNTFLRLLFLPNLPDGIGLSIAFINVLLAMGAIILSVFVDDKKTEKVTQRYDTQEAGAIGLDYEGSHMQKFAESKSIKNGASISKKWIEQMKKEQAGNYKNIDEDTKQALNQLFNKDNDCVVQEDFSQNSSATDFSEVFHGKK